METESLADLPTEQGFHLQESLWKIVERLTLENIVERSEIKKVIGESLIDETIDLHVELSSLIEIWTEFQKEDNSIVQNFLPDPPFLRENLEKQITMLVELLQQKLSVREGRQQGFTAFLSNEEREIIKSISREGSSSTSGKKSNNNCAAATKMSTPRISSAKPKAPIREDSMNVFEIDQLADTLRQEFERERKDFMSDIEKIQAALIYGSEQRDTRSQRQSSATIKELQNLNNKLEKTVLSPRKPPNKNPQHSSQNSRPSKWSNNFQKPVKLSPSPPSTANTSTYRHPNLLTGAHSARKMVNVTNVTVTL